MIKYNFYKNLDYVIIGTGKNRYPIPDSVTERFKGKFNIDILPTVIIYHFYKNLSSKRLPILTFVQKI